MILSNSYYTNFRIFKKVSKYLKLNDQKNQHSTGKIVYFLRFLFFPSNQHTVEVTGSNPVSPTIFLFSDIGTSLPMTISHFVFQDNQIQLSMMSPEFKNCGSNFFHLFWNILCDYEETTLYVKAEILLSLGI